MNTESLFPGMLIYKVQLNGVQGLFSSCSQFEDGCGWEEEASSPSTLYKKKRSKMWKYGWQLPPVSFYQTEQTQAFLLKVITFSFLPNDVDSKWTYEIVSEQKNRQHNTHTDLSSLSCQTLFITLNMYSTGPFVLAQCSANSTQYTNKSSTDIFLKGKIQRLELN